LQVQTQAKNPPTKNKADKIRQTKNKADKKRIEVKECLDLPPDKKDRE
jgi:hypothetical protein